MNNFFTSIVRRGKNNTRVMLADGTTMLVPSKSIGIDWIQADLATQVMYQTAARPIDISEVTFGMEFEFIGEGLSAAVDAFNAAMHALLPSRYRHSGCYGRSSTTQWVLGRDGSLTPERRNGCVDPFGYELTSPILRFTEECATEISDVLGLVRLHLKGFVNRTCGSHVHVGNFTNSGTNWAVVDKMALLYGSLETLVFDELVSASRRASVNSYCGTLAGKCAGTSRDKMFKMSTRNFCGIGTVENRQHQGTLSSKKLINWATLIAKFCVFTTRQICEFGSSFDYSNIDSMGKMLETLEITGEMLEYFVTREF